MFMYCYDSYLKTCTMAIRIHFPLSPQTLLAVISKNTSAYSRTVNQVLRGAPEVRGTVLRDSLMMQSLNRTRRFDIEYTNSVITLEF